MLENCVPPVMRATGSEKLSWLDENRKTVQAMEDMAIPNSAGLTVSKVCHGEQPQNTTCWFLSLLWFPPQNSLHGLQTKCDVQLSVHSATMTSVCHVGIGHALDVLLHVQNVAVHLACKTPLSILFAPSLLLAAVVGHNRPGPAKGSVPCRDGTCQAYQEPSSACIRIYLPGPVAPKYIPAATQAEE